MLNIQYVEHNKEYINKEEVLEKVKFALGLEQWAKLHRWKINKKSISHQTGGVNKSEDEHLSTSHVIL